MIKIIFYDHKKKKNFTIQNISKIINHKSSINEKNSYIVAVSIYKDHFIFENELYTLLEVIYE